MTLNVSLVDQIALELRADIIRGRLSPGMPLIEKELVNAYNASRNTIREALHRLDQEGLTRYVRNKSFSPRSLSSYAWCSALRRMSSASNLPGWSVTMRYTRC